MNKFKHFGRVIADSLKIIHRLDKHKIPIMSAKALITSAVPFVAIIMSAEIINRLSIGAEFGDTLIFALVSVTVIFALTILGDWLKKCNEVKNTHCRRLYDFSKNEKMMTMDYSELESPASSKLRTTLRAQEAMGFDLPFLLTGLDTLAESVFTAVLSLTLLIPAISGGFPAIGIILFILLSTMLSVAISALRRRLDDKLLETIKDDGYWPDEALQSDVMRATGTFTYKEGKDIRIYGFKDAIRNVFAKQARFLLSIDGVFATKPALMYGVVAAMRGLIMGGSFLFVALLSPGGMALGTVVLLASVLYQFTAGVSKIITASTSVISTAESLQLYLQFISAPDSQYKGTLPLEKRQDREYEIEFRNVSFKYPGSETYALRNLNLKFSVGKRMAVVGMNGSGKTTMIKLLCRLCDPTEGEILLGGVNIAKYDMEQYRSIFSVVFQDFKLFSFTLNQNVAVSESGGDADKIITCLSKAGIAERVETMPMGIDTPLYKNFDENGVEVSGGEAQKIAIARALYKDAPFLVLDEPTAALDPIAEFEIYSKLGDIVEDKTAIFISHRLSSCRFCDDIAVFHQGELIQRGGHDKLLADETGKYCELWNAQAQYYC